MVQKADIFIKYKNYIKNISLKCGRSNSVHHEQVQEFKRYLGNIGIPYKTIDIYMNYHFGYGRDSDNKKSINKTRIIVDMIDRFIIRGRNSDYDIDALISGTIDDYV